MRKQKIPETIVCPNCEGCGEIDNPIWRGREMRRQRDEAAKTLSEVANSMHFSKGYLSDLELGRRAWNSNLIAAYEKALR
jgi:predicted transcriptional regulator